MRIINVLKNIDPWELSERYTQAAKQIARTWMFPEKPKRGLMGSSSKYIESTQGVKIYYEVDHPIKDSCIIFLHGLGGNLTAWDEERKILRGLGYQTLALDLRGHGLSDRPKNAKFYKIRHLVQDVFLIIKQENIKNCIIVGHCVGGMVTILLGAKRKTNIKSVILIDTNYKPPYLGQFIYDKKYLSNILSVIVRYSPTLAFRRHSDLSQFVGTGDYNLRRIAYDVVHTSLKSYLLFLEEFCKFDATKSVSRINKPTLILQGLRDSVFPPYLAFDLADKIKGSKLEFIEEANHILVINNPMEIANKIDNFLKTSIT